MGDWSSLRSGVRLRREVKREEVRGEEVRGEEKR